MRPRVGSGRRAGRTTQKSSRGARQARIIFNGEMAFYYRHQAEYEARSKNKPILWRRFKYHRDLARSSTAVTSKHGAPFFMAARAAKLAWRHSSAGGESKGVMMSAGHACNLANKTPGSERGR